MGQRLQDVKKGTDEHSDGDSCILLCLSSTIADIGFFCLFVFLFGDAPIQHHFLLSL